MSLSSIAVLATLLSSVTFFYHPPLMVPLLVGSSSFFLYQNSFCRFKFFRSHPSLPLYTLPSSSLPHLALFHSLLLRSTTLVTSQFIQTNLSGVLLHLVGTCPSTGIHILFLKAKVAHACSVLLNKNI
jgi:hypothetical protein